MVLKTGWASVGFGSVLFCQQAVQLVAELAVRAAVCNACFQVSEEAGGAGLGPVQCAPLASSCSTLSHTALPVVLLCRLYCSVACTDLNAVRPESRAGWLPPPPLPATLSPSHSRLVPHSTPSTTPIPYAPFTHPLTRTHPPRTSPHVPHRPPCQVCCCVHNPHRGGGDGAGPIPQAGKVRRQALLMIAPPLVG